MKLGIVGLPNVGKSTLFNAITDAGAQSANYPFCTIEPNIGVVAVPDKRLDKLAEMYDPDKYTPASIEFVDIVFVCPFNELHFSYLQISSTLKYLFSSFQLTLKPSVLYLLFMTLIVSL